MFYFIVRCSFFFAKPINPTRWVYFTQKSDPLSCNHWARCLFLSSSPIVSKGFIVFAYIALAGSLKSRILSRVTQTKSCTQKISETIWRPTKACGIKIARAEKVAQFGRFKVVKFISSTKLHSQLSEIMFAAFKALARKLRTERRSRRSYFRTFLELGTRIAREKFEWRI